MVSGITHSKPGEVNITPPKSEFKLLVCKLDVLLDKTDANVPTLQSTHT